MVLEPVVCPECGAVSGLTQVEPDTYYCSHHKGMFKYVGVKSKLFRGWSSEAMSDVAQNSRSDGGLLWRRSANSEIGACVEVAFLGTEILIRHSANPSNTAISLSKREWADFLRGAREGEFDFAESGAGASTASQMEIYVYLDTDEESVASSVFESIDELARAVGAVDIALTEFSRSSFIRRAKASIQSGLSDAIVQQRLQTLERFVELWQLDPRQAEVDQRTSEAFARMVSWSFPSLKLADS